MRYELIDGDPKLISKLATDGWKLINTFPNPYPQPYFFALMLLEKENEDEYDIIFVTDLIRQPNVINKLIGVWNRTENDARRIEMFQSDDLKF